MGRTRVLLCGLAVSAALPLIGVAAPAQGTTRAPAGTAHVPVSAVQVQAGDVLEPAVTALGRRFAAKAGVSYSQRTRGALSLPAYRATEHGKHRLAPGPGIHASDTTTRFTWGDGDDGTQWYRVIIIGRDLYTQEAEGGKWAHSRETKGSGALWAQDLIDPLNPRFLRLISPDAEKTGTGTGDRYDGVRTTRYDGSVRVELLGVRGAGYYFGPGIEGSGGGRIDWKLWLGPDDLPRRFQAAITFDPPEHAVKPDVIRINVLYRDWGKPVRVQAPAARLVVESL
ncbi:hypothetical protein HII36_31410 [Nonomuraea sp. NN258]|uniref:hypothetical protein n=1 Tax=Nonomuraea antri TaxID=2730852 RepID=UPI001569BA13|nr:hypothetical protein [Nonomuraea antri]NRQ36309.1 hypothetical protein [Nonomuraea antri]